MSDTTEGIERALVAWEGAARAAVGEAIFTTQTGRWVAEDVHDQHGPIPLVFAVTESGAKTQVANFEAAWEPDERRAHIALNDPAAVLRMVAGIRAVVALADEATGLDMTVEGDRGVGPRDTDVDPWLGDQILQALAAMFAPAAEGDAGVGS